jgi:predicted RNA-binding Zn ribbon-like protein
VADPDFLLLGDALWLDFVNTAATSAGVSDTLPDPGAWLRWTKAVRVESPASAHGFEDALRFRTRLLALARSLDQRQSPPPSMIETINVRLAALEGRQQLVRVSGSWRMRFAPGRPPTALEAIAGSVAETLSNPLAAVRQCTNPECGLFFVDESPNQSRRWCSRSRCGLTGGVERRRRSRPTPLVGEG